MFKNRHLLLWILVWLILTPHLIFAQQLPYAIETITGAKTTKSPQNFSVKFQDYVAFVQDMQACKVNFFILSYDKASQVAIIRLNRQTLQKYVQSSPHVCNVEEINLPIVTPESIQNDHNFNINQINRLQSEFPALTGEGMLVSIHEPMFDVSDVDLKGRFVSKGAEAVYDESLKEHPTNMATFVAGAGNSSTRGKGVAFKANITSSDNANAQPESDAYYQNAGIVAQNHSYGFKGQVNNVYDANARAFDLSANNNDQLLHVISSGNDGNTIATDGNYKDVKYYANLSGGFKMAKNVLTIGGIYLDKEVLPFSSKGPAYDGRVKPELVAYGGGLLFGGTSNAAAITTGIVTLLQQAYKTKKGQFPSATLLRAMLINSAEDVATKGVDFETGYGNINAYRAHQNLMAEQYVTGTATQGNTSSFNIDVPANATNLKITLVWNDPAAAANANAALVNDLDLSVTQATNTWLPWVLQTTPDTNVLRLPATRGVDRLNTIEQVTVESPVVGTYAIQVKGHNLTASNQSFYVAYQWDLKDTFSWTFPVAGDNLPYHGESFNYFRWESTFAAGQTGKIELSIDGGQTWEVIASEVDLNQGAYRWEEVKDVFAVAMARMTVNGKVYNTQNFTLSKPLRVSTGFDCGDSVMVQWEKAPNIQSYTLYTPGDQYLKELTQTTDTFFVFYKSQLPNTNEFTVVPHFNTTTSAIQSVSYDYNNGAVKCYLESFFAQPKVDTGIVLNLKLATIYGVKSIVYERKNGEVFESIATATSGETTAFAYIDRNPFSRLNTYRARVLFNNGQELVTDLADAYYLDQEQFIFFPNPVTRDQPLNIFSKNFQEERIYFKLYNSKGKVVYSDAYSADRFSVDLSKYPAGLYYYRIGTDDTQKTGKIILK